MKLAGCVAEKGGKQRQQRTHRHEREVLQCLDEGGAELVKEGQQLQSTKRKTLAATTHSTAPDRAERRGRWRSAACVRAFSIGLRREVWFTPRETHNNGDCRSKQGKKEAAAFFLSLLRRS